MKLKVLYILHVDVFFKITIFLHSLLFEQEDNGIPIHLKGGSKDALLYRATMTLTVFESGSHTSYQWLDPIVITEADFESEMTVI